MAEELGCKYPLGICYSCQKCLYCFNFPQRNPCKCKKNKQPSRIKNPLRGQQIYQRAFTPDLTFPRSNKYLFDANIRFGYNSNFEESFSYTFCSRCNSQIQKFRKADKKAQQVQQVQMKENDNASGDLSNEKEAGIGNKNNENEKDQRFLLENLASSANENDDVVIDDDDDDDDSDSDSDLEEVKVQIIVKSKDIKAPTAKTITIEPVNYKKITEKINSVVQKALGKKIKSKDYIISYKAVNARGPSNELEDELDFQEFIGEYKRIVIAGKKMSMIVVIRDNVVRKKNKHKKVMFFIYVRYNKQNF
jgi:hypothetical protein